MKISAIIAAAGSSSRFGKQKLLEELNGKTIIETTILKISSSELVDEIIICASEDIFEQIKEIAGAYPKVKKVILGGETRQESVYKGLMEALGSDFILIHDGARPLLELSIMENTIKEAVLFGHAACAVSVKDTIKIVEDNKIISSLERGNLYKIQTPQVFRALDIIEAHEKFRGMNATDDTSLIEEMGKEVKIVKGCYRNIKITTPEDICLARVFANGGL